MDLTFLARRPTVEEYLGIEAQLPDFDTTSPEQAAVALDHTLASVVVYDDEECVGLGRLLGDASIYWLLVDIWVVPRLQGQGVGTEIVERLLDHIKTTAVPGTSVSVILMAARGKEGFYERFGFRRRPHGYEGSGMELELDIALA
jgi:GNAT superfamily N-acetyltransferase